MFDYIEENLEKIKNPNNVNVIATHRDENGCCLRARLNNGESLQLTKSMGRMRYPYEPINYIYNELGRFYWEDFGGVFGNIAINKKHLTRLCYIDLTQINPKSKWVRLYAYFDDGRKSQLMDSLKKYFFKKLKAEIEQEMEMQFEDITEEVRQEKGLNQ